MVHFRENWRFGTMFIKKLKKKGNTQFHKGEPVNVARQKSM